MEEAHNLIDNLDISDEQKARLKEGILKTYSVLGHYGIGVLESVCKLANKEIKDLSSKNYELENGDGGCGRS